MNVICHIDPDNNRVFIHRGDSLIGWVNDEGVLELLGDALSGTSYISMDDLDIVMDNWNQLQEKQRAKTRVSKGVQRESWIKQNPIKLPTDRFDCPMSDEDWKQQR